LQTDPIDFFDGSEYRTNVRIKDYLVANFEYHYYMKWPAFFISLAFVIVLRFAVAIATKYLHFQKR
jgi:CDR ABC transporter